MGFGQLRRFPWIAAIGMVLMLPAITHAQEASISGTVTDTTGAVLPGVTIRAVHEASGNSFETVTDERGNYRMPLRIGVYQVTAQLQGFTTVTRTGLELLVGQDVTLPLQMSVSAVAETVTVTGEAPLLDVTSSALGGNIDQRQMSDLPVNGRNWIDLALLAPGNRANSVTEAPSASGSTGDFHLNVDGQQVTATVAGAAFGQPRYSRDAMAEFEFVSNRFDATQGRSTGVQVNAVTKSGTNTFLGTLSGYFRDDRFNAADHVTGRVLPYSNQQIGSTFGGPIRRDRVHFFGNYEYEREPQTFAYTTPYPRFNRDQTGARREHKGGARLDVQFTPQTRLSARVNKWANRLPYDSRYTGGADRTPSSAVGVNRDMNQVFMSLTQVLSNRAVNEVKGGYADFGWDMYSYVKNPGSTITGGFGAPQIQLQGLTIGHVHLYTPQEFLQRHYEVRDDFTYSFDMRGRHDLKLGGEYLFSKVEQFFCNICMGVLDATGGRPPANLEDLFPDLMDVSTWNLAALSPITRRWRQFVGDFAFDIPRHISAFWVQDDWVITPALTLNLGLRYDLQVNAFLNDVGIPPFLEPNRPQDLDNVAPRVGFAYRMTDRTVFRGGFGTYFGDLSNPHFTKAFSQQILPETPNDGRPDFAANPFNGPAPTFESLQSRLCTTSTRPDCIRPELTPGGLIRRDSTIPYAYQASMGVQRQLGAVLAVEADYVYTGNRDGTTGFNANLAYDAATGRNFPFSDISKRPYPAWGRVDQQFGGARSSYHGLQMAMTKRFSSGWQASATYLLSGVWQRQLPPIELGCTHPLTMPSPGVFRCDVPIQLHPVLADEWYNTGAQLHRFVFNGIWAVGYGFQVSGLYLFGDEGKLTPVAGQDVLQSGVGGAGGRLRANGTIIERNSFDAKAHHRVDLRVQRRFALGGRVSLDGIFELFNAFNRANYGTWVTNEANRNYGRPAFNANIAYQPRVAQLGFRLAF